MYLVRQLIKNTANSQEVAIRDNMEDVHDNNHETMLLVFQLTVKTTAHAHRVVSAQRRITFGITSCKN